MLFIDLINMTFFFYLFLHIGYYYNKYAIILMNVNVTEIVFELIIILNNKLTYEMAIGNSAFL